MVTLCIKAVSNLTVQKRWKCLQTMKRQKVTLNSVQWYTRKVFKVLLSKASVNFRDRCLDIGCGTGNVTAIVVKKMVV